MNGTKTGIKLIASLVGAALGLVAFIFGRMCRIVLNAFMEGWSG
jgi:hypothetical protein